MLKDFGISLSLANLCFIKVWGRLLSKAGAYFNEFPVMFAGIILDVLLLALLFWIGITIVRQTKNAKLKTVAKSVFWLAVVTSLNGILVLLSTFLPFTFSRLFGHQGAAISGIIFSAAFLITAFHLRDKIFQFAPKALMALIPFAFVTLFQAVWHLEEPPALIAKAEAKNESSVTVTADKNAKTRILWIIFDELDQQVTFSARPSSIQLPELDKLRSESFHGENAYSPSPLTHISMPALITGKLISKVSPAGPTDMFLYYEGANQPVRWSEQPNVFQLARRSGYKTGVVGWNHPYCEILGNSLTLCKEVRENRASDISIASSMFENAKGVISTIPLLTQAVIPIVQRVELVNFLVTSGERQKYRIRYETILSNATLAATDSQLDLVMVHFPIPHPPGIYDRYKDDFSMNGSSSYIDNLELVDKTVGTLRREMEKAGIWEDTTVLISADHWWRTTMWKRGPFWSPTNAELNIDPNDHRIPFILKLANQNNGVAYQKPFNTIITKELLLALLRGDVSDKSSVTDWLNKNSTLADSPYNKEELLP